MKKEYKNNLISIELSSDADSDLFKNIANILEAKFKAKSIQKLNGFDELYWDYEIFGKKICLHYQHYLGIFINAIDLTANQLVEEIAVSIKQDLK